MKCGGKNSRVMEGELQYFVVWHFHFQILPKDIYNVAQHVKNGQNSCVKKVKRELKTKINPAYVLTSAQPASCRVKMVNVGFQYNHDGWPLCGNTCYTTYNLRTSRKAREETKPQLSKAKNDSKSKSAFKQPGSKWMLTVNWRSVESRNSWERLTRGAGEEWLIIVCLFVCVSVCLWLLFMWSCYDTTMPAGVQALRSTFVALPHLLNTHRNARQQDPEHTNTKIWKISNLAKRRKHTNTQPLVPSLMLTFSLQ